MTQNSKAREQAEIAFSKTQTEHLARSRTLSEADEIEAKREAKTARLRELRLEKEASDALNAAKGGKNSSR